MRENKKTLNERILAENVRVHNDGYVTGLNGNDLVIGTAGSGKTTHVRANLNNPCGSFVVQDTKGTLYKQYAASLRSKGYEVSVIDFVNPDNSFGYNPLSYIRKHPDGSLVETDVKKLATQLTPILDRSEPFWEKAACRYVSMIIGFVLESLPESEHNMRSVIDVHREFQDYSGKDMLRAWSKESPDSYSARKFRLMEGSLDADKTISCIMEFVNEILDGFDTNEFNKIFLNPNTFDMHEVGRKPSVVFINTSDHDTSFAVLTTVFYSQLLQVLLDEADSQPDGRLKVPVRLYLDDFASAAAIADFDKTISIIRSRDIAVSVMIQSLSQLESMYSEPRANTIINNCDHILYLGGGHDMRTAQFIGSHINRTAYSVLTLPLEKAILITRGEEPRFVTKLNPLSPVTGYERTA